MRPTLTITMCCLLLAVMAGCNTVRGTVHLQAGKEYVLGPDQQKQFSVYLHNPRFGNVHAYMEDAGGNIISGFIIGSQKDTTVQIAPGNRLRLQNTNNHQLGVAVVIPGGKNLARGHL